MIRKTIIVAFSVTALALFVVSVIGHWMPFETCILNRTNGPTIGFEARGRSVQIRIVVPVYDSRVTSRMLSNWQLYGFRWYSHLLALDDNRVTLRACGCRAAWTRTRSSNALHDRLILIWPMPVSVLVAIYPMFAFIRGPVRRWRRRRRSLCIRCGYNLEGNVSGVCPECGETT
ncbi:MAG: hypothetical protein IH987_11215 [Planctomycetes bacterium]|nr:hypothetical protein [Planctomycetota bacterium]